MNNTCIRNLSRGCPRRLAAILLVVLGSCAAPGRADTQWVPVFYYQGQPLPVDEIWVDPGVPFTLDVNALVLTDVEAEIVGYTMDFFPTSFELGLGTWADQTGWQPLLHEYPWFHYMAPELPGIPVSPPADGLALGSVSFLPMAPGTYGVQLGEASNIFDLYSGLIPPAVLPPVTVYCGLGPGPEPPPGPPGPPPVPPDYDMGTVVNGNFEGGGGTLNGWSTDAWPEGSSVQVDTFDGDHVAHLYAEGEWWEESGPGGPGPGGEWWWYNSGQASISQTIYVPADATTLTFVYATQESAELEGNPRAGVSLGGTWTGLPDSGDWSTYTFAVPEELRGRRNKLIFSADDSGWGDSEWGPEGVNTIDLWVDYIGMDGTTVLQSTTWSAPWGGVWENADNWSPNAVPDNSMATAHDVDIPETATGEPITLSSAKTVQSLEYDRSAGPLEIQSAGSLHIIDFANFNNGAVVIHPGGGLSFEEDANFNDTTVSINPSGAASGSTAIAVGRRLTLRGASAQMDIQDATVTASYVNVEDGASITVHNSAGFTGQSRLEATGSYRAVDIYNGTLNIGPGAVVATPELYIRSHGTVNVNGGTIEDMSPGGTRNYGTVTFTGTCQVDQDYLRNYETLTFTDADVTFTGNLSQYDRMTLTRSTISVGGDFWIGSYQDQLSADADSTIRIHDDLSNWCDDAATFDLDEVTVEFLAGSASQLRVQGSNVGPFTSGLLDNFGIGSLVVSGGTLGLAPGGTGGNAQYVRDLTLEAGTTLDLNGIPLYYTGTFMNNGATITDGEVRRAYTRPEALPPATITGYTASGEAAWSSGSTTDTPLELEGYGTGAEMQSYAHVEAWADTEDRCRITIHLHGEPGGEWVWDEWGEDWIETPAPPASAEVDALFTVPAGPGYPDGSPLELLIVLNLEGEPPQWDWELFRADDVLASRDMNNTEAWVMVDVGETLRIVASMNDDSNWYDDDLVLTVYSIPEPGTLALLAFGAAGIIIRRRRWPHP